MKLKILSSVVAMSLSGVAFAGNYSEYSPGSSYSAGDRVKVGNTLYECKQYASWCSSAGYAPGGVHGGQAWAVVPNSNTSVDTTTKSEATTSGSTSSNASGEPEVWQPGRAYGKGVIVVYNGKLYSSNDAGVGASPAGWGFTYEGEAVVVKSEADKAEANRIAKEATDKAEADRIAKEATDKAEADRIAKEAADKAEADRIAKEAANKAKADRIAKEAADKAEADRIAKEAADKAEAAKKTDYPEWESGKAYIKGAIVTYNGKYYIANGAGEGASPIGWGFTAVELKDLDVDDYKSEFLEQWKANYPYKRTDVVEHNDKYYICLDLVNCRMVPYYSEPGEGQVWGSAWKQVVSKNAVLAVKVEPVEIDAKYLENTYIKNEPNTILAEKGLVDNSCNIDSYENTGGNTVIKMYCNDKAINLTRSKIIIKAKEDFGPHISAQIPGAETSVKIIDGSKLEITFAESSKEKSILDTRRDSLEIAIKELTTIKNEFDLIDEITFDSPQARDARVKELNDSANELQGTEEHPGGRIGRFRDMIKLMSTDLILNPKTIETVAIYNANLNASNIESITVEDAKDSMTVPVKPVEIKYPDYIKEFNFKEDDAVMNSGIVKLFANAAKNDPALQGKVDTHGNAFEKAKRYYNALFFPTRDTYSIFVNDESAYKEFMARKKNCYAREAFTAYSGCDVYYSFENLIDAYKLLVNNYPELHDLANTEDPRLNKRQLAAFFANIAQETNGGSYASKFTGLPYAMTTMVETPCNLIPGLCSGYSVGDHGQEFYGRGAKQLSYPENYIFYSSAIFGNQYILYNTPDILVHPITTTVGTYTRPGMYGYATGLAYMALRYNDGCERGLQNCGPNKEYEFYVKPSMLEGLDPDWENIEITQGGNKVKIGNKFGESGFGQTINIINGGVECKADVQEQNLNRISGYIEMLMRLNAGVDKVVITKKDDAEEVINSRMLLNNLINNPVKFDIGDHQHTPILNSSPIMGSGASDLRSYLDQIAKIELVYNDGFTERLDCVGYGHFG
ncbi:glycoside hydrolase family 19 protein [Francisella sciaenopsi]|uniref:Chitin-binding type-3 domain-containing protein n=1 Tax=Francisella sciaenopsi TaxID=3055034 RepID=A0ABQ6PG55_9GAMM